MNNHLIEHLTVGKKEIVFPKGTEPLLFLLEVDPRHIYAYWEISPKELAIIVDQTGKFFHESRLILRIYEGNNPNNHKVEIGSYFDISVKGWKNKWYVEISNSLTSCYAELGLKYFTSDDFYLIKSSNVITTPQNIISSNKQEQWMKVLGDYEEAKIVGHDQEPSEGLSSSQRSVDRKMIEEYYANLYQKDWREIFPAQVQTGEGFTIGQEKLLNRSEFGTEDYSAFIPQTDDQVKTEKYDEFLTLSSYSPSFEVPGSFSSYALLSSWPPEEKITSNRFFQYGTDLVIYGKTQPEAVLYIDGRKVEIRPDGTFSWRLNLSREGDYRIPLQVVLQGGEEIWELIPFHIQKVKRSGD